METASNFAEGAGAAFNDREFACRLYVEHHDSGGQTSVNLLPRFSHSGINNGVGSGAGAQGPVNSPPESGRTAFADSSGLLDAQRDRLGGE